MNKIEYLLVCLNEECVEIAKDATKALRFGLNDRNELAPDSKTNAERLMSEVNDLLGVMNMLVEECVIPPYWQNEAEQGKKIEKVNKFMKYSRDCGTLS